MYLLDGQTTTCCNSTIWAGEGLSGVDVCCDHEPETGFRDFKVCWTPETTCKTNADCADLGSNYFCNLENVDEDCGMGAAGKDTCGYYPTQGTCVQITEEDYVDADSISNLGTVRKGTTSMSWWAGVGLVVVENSSL